MPHAPAARAALSACHTQPLVRRHHRGAGSGCATDRRTPLQPRVPLAPLAMPLAMLLALLSGAAPLRAQTPDSAWAARYEALGRARGEAPDSVRLHRLFDLDWEYRNTEYPEMATYTGYPGQNDRWTDRSLQAIARRERALQRPLAVLRSIDRARLAPDDQLDYDLFRRAAEQAVAGTRFPSEYLAITQMDGPQYLAATLELAPAATVRDYEAMLARLAAIPAVLTQDTVLLAQGLAAGVTPPRITLRDVPEQVRTLLTDAPLRSPLLAPFARIPSGIPPAEQARLRDSAAVLYRTRVRPAYQALLAYLTTTYIPRARETIAMSALPDGAAWYAYNVRRETTTDLTPQQIHARGLAEVARIRAQMDSLIRAIGFQGSFADFARFLRTDARFYYTDSAALVRGYRDIAKRVDPGLATLVGTLPRLPYGVRAIPSYQAPSQTTAYYQPGAPAAGRPGWFYVNTYKLDTRPTWEMQPLTMHEAVPGHHLQIARAQELSGVPAFRRYGDYTAFVEGWALYAESLGPAIGMYGSPYDKFGQLTYEMWRALRLVIDTGIHSMGWTRQQAIDYFRANSAKTEQDITVEVDRYIVWPGQALAYKTGAMEIQALRAEAEQALGARFDVRAFHDQVLGAGALPLDILAARVRRWIAAQRAAPDTAARAR